jgi:hypothetical protein
MSIPLANRAVRLGWVLGIAATVVFFGSTIRAWDLRDLIPDLMLLVGISSSLDCPQDGLCMELDEFRGDDPFGLRVSGSRGGPLGGGGAALGGSFALTRVSEPRGFSQDNWRGSSESDSQGLPCWNAVQHRKAMVSLIRDTHPTREYG